MQTCRVGVSWADFLPSFPCELSEIHPNSPYACLSHTFNDIVSNKLNLQPSSHSILHASEDLIRTNHTTGRLFVQQYRVSVLFSLTTEKLHEN